MFDFVIEDRGGGDVGSAEVFLEVLRAGNAIAKFLCDRNFESGIKAKYKRRSSSHSDFKINSNQPAQSYQIFSFKVNEKTLFQSFSSQSDSLNSVTKLSKFLITNVKHDVGRFVLSNSKGHFYKNFPSPGGGVT